MRTLAAIVLALIGLAGQFDLAGAAAPPRVVGDWKGGAALNASDPGRGASAQIFLRITQQSGNRFTGISGGFPLEGSIDPNTRRFVARVKDQIGYTEYAGTLSPDGTQISGSTLTVTGDVRSHGTFTVRRQ